MDVKMDLKKKIGPLPIWAWIAIVGGSVAAYLVLSRSSGSSTSSSAAAAGTGNSVDPSNPLGLTFTQEAADEAEGIDPETGDSYVDEADNELSGGGTGLSDGDSGDESFTGQLGDVVSEINALKKLENTLNPTKKGGKGRTTPTATTKGEIFRFGTKPKPRHGYHIKGLGKGWWALIPDKKHHPTKAKHHAKATSAGGRHAAPHAARTTGSRR